MFIDFTPPPEFNPYHPAAWDTACCELETDPGDCEQGETPPGKPDDDDTVTTLALGEEGGEHPAPDAPRPKPGNPLGPTTLALGEEGGEHPPFAPR